MSQVVDATKLTIGPCRVTLDGANLGATLGEVVFSYSPEYQDLLADQFGTTPVDKSLVGEIVQLTVPLTEIQLSTIKRGIPMGTDVGGKRTTFGSNAAKLLKQFAGQLVLHPLAYADADRTGDIVIHKAAVADPVELGFSPDNQRVFEVTFTALIDTSKTAGNWLGFYGDSV